MRTKLQNGENVALVVRKHWFVLTKPALFFVAVLFFGTLRNSKLYGFEGMIKIFFPYALAIAIGFFIYCWLDRRTNIWVVTNNRLIDESGVISRNTKENKLDKINDIIVNQTVLGRMFGFGSVVVQTAAAIETVIDFVEKPQELRDTVNAQKAMTADQANQSSLHLSGPRASAGNVQRTVLIDRDVTVPFAVGCPHCNGRITLDYAPLLSGTSEARVHQAEQPEESRGTGAPEAEKVQPVPATRQEAVEEIAQTVEESAAMPEEQKPEEAVTIDEQPDPRAWRREVR
jgi:membrane protein YdbS with pleckstrin-like domain